MKKINIELLEYPMLRVETIQKIRLGPFWDNITLSGGFWRIYYQTASGAGVLLNGKKYELLPHRLYLIAPYADLKTYCNAGMLIQYYIHFEINFFAGNINCPIHEIALKGDLEHTFSRFIAILDQGSDPMRGGLLAMQIAAAALSQLPDDALVKLDVDQRIARVCDFMRQNISRQIGLEDFARVANYATNSFLRRFREATGGTPYQYLLHLRYAQAARLLGSTDLSIKEICAEIGVSDRFHFSRCFKHIYGSSPAAYRRGNRSFSGTSGQARPAGDRPED